MPLKPDRSIHWLGKYLSLALTLPASVVAGYLIGTFADNHFHLPILRAVGIVLGMAGGMIQVFREVTRDEKRK
jgi:F0F1-type ATP synthase assembly protein I